MQIRVLANLRPSLNITAQSNDEINDKDWRNNPKIVVSQRGQDDLDGGWGCENSTGAIEKILGLYDPIVIQK